MKYRILEDHWIENGPKRGEVLSQYTGHDYGMVRYEAECLGEPCIALRSPGGVVAPMFYVFPLSCVEQV